MDNGCGIPKDELTLAATRHATSKLQSVDDFAKLQSFGFRGEALAATSLVSRLTIVSRTKDSSIGFCQTYDHSSHHQHQSTTTTTTATTETPKPTPPKPQARTLGTTVTVSDLFYNLAHRKRSLRPVEDYNKVLQLLQRYAVEYPWVRWVCRKRQLTQKKKKTAQAVDFNTGMLSQVQTLQKQVEEEANNNNGSAAGDQKESLNNKSSPEKDAATKQILIHVFGSNLSSHLTKVLSTSSSSSSDKYQMVGWISDASYEGGKSGTTQLVLFCNHRLVESWDLRRKIEAVYAEFTTHKPVAYLSIRVPPAQVDVNVHPTKKQVALLYQDEIFEDISKIVTQSLQSQGHAFSRGSVQPVSTPNKIKKRRPDQTTDVEPTPGQKRQKPTPSVVSPPASQLVRTSAAAQAGAMEAYVVRTQPESSPEPNHVDDDDEETQSSTASRAPSATTQEEAVTLSQPLEDSFSPDAKHDSTCPLAGNVDLSQPGAFAMKCTCGKKSVRVRRTTMMTRIPKIVNTQCTYRSIKSLRKQHMWTNSYKGWKEQEAVLVGQVSPQRCLVQCGVGLQEWNTERMAQMLFQQLALRQFGGMTIAEFAEPVDIQRVVAQILELEDSLSSENNDDDDDDDDDVAAPLEASESNEELARQAATCLLDQSSMLEEYFSIRIKSVVNERPHLIGLPVLLAEYEPDSAGLPLFLLRLATEVDWATEKNCFEGVSRELGLYYGEQRSTDVRSLFPAICHLLVPSANAHRQCVKQLTTLGNLYKEFERC